MKIIANILRVFVGLLFIFSGLIKANDPTGFSYKLDEYFSVFSADLETKQDSILLEIKGLDKQVQQKIQINASNPNLQLVVETTDWKAVPVESGVLDSLYFSEAKFLVDGQVIAVASLNAKDSNTTVLKTDVRATVGNKELKAQKLVFKSFEDNKQVVTINASNYTKANNAIVNWLQSLRPYALSLAILICILEILLGWALLIGAAPKLTAWLLLLMIIFFSFLTWYSANFNKVTDCGCFGDAIKLTPWESFYKDLILLASTSLILLGIKYIKPIFSTPFAVRFLTVVTLLATGFSVYCWHYLPAKNFLKFKVGNDIKKLSVVPEGAPSDKYENIFIYAKNGVNEEFTLDQMNGRDLKAEGYVFVDRRDKLISKGFEPEIHDFKIMDEGRTNDYVDDFFADSTWKMLVVINDVQNANIKAMKELSEIAEFWTDRKHGFYAITASDVTEVEEFRHTHQLAFPFYYGDKTNLKSIIRSNPGILLFKGNVVMKTWPSTSLPSTEKLEKLIK